jgi:CNT family concentrative nucleoside transporter
MSQFQGFIGLIGLVAIAWLISEQRRELRWRVPLIGLALQFLIAALMLKLPASRAVFAVLNDGVVALQAATEAGTSFVFGYRGRGPLPYEETEVGSSLVFAFRSLPLLIVMSALTALLSYWRVLPLIVNALSALLAKTLSVGGPWRSRPRPTFSSAWSRPRC